VINTVLAPQKKVYNLHLAKATFFEKPSHEFESFFDLKQQPNAFWRGLTIATENANNLAF